MYDYGPGKQDWVTAGLPTEGRAPGTPRAGDVANRDVPTCRLDEPMEEVRARTEAAGFDTCVVVNEHRIILGLLRSRTLSEDGTAEEAMRPGPSTFRPNAPIVELLQLMTEHDLPNMPITTNDGELIGLLTQEDAKKAAADILKHEHHHEDHE